MTGDGLGSVWLRDAERPPPRAAITLDDLVGAAVRLLDAEGLDGLSMRKVAAELGTAATSALYWRVRTKSDLLELAVDAVLGEALDQAPVRHGWRRELESLTGAALATLRRHRWAAQLLASHAGFGPNYQRYSLRVLDTLAEAGFTDHRLDAAVSAVFHYLIGVAVTEAATSAAVLRSGRSEREWAAAVARRAGGGAVGRFLDRPESLDPDHRFTAGLGVILDGLAGAV